MIRGLTIACLLILFSTSIAFSQDQAKPDLNNRGIAKIIEDDVVLAKSFKQGAVYTIAYLNQLEPELKGYASFSFEEKGNTAEKIYNLVRGRFNEETPQPVSFTTPKGTIKFEYGLSETDSVWVRLAQYDVNNRLEAYSVYLSPEHLKQLLEQ
ncbi:MAG: hypothetical protein CMF35_11645 [Leeuwenhoekiella sp.]|uniref:hypothetical protein n=1 Tax=Leeuwenhoekiella blandensis TaxID=360293 RepID=UPI000C48AFE0|nr:hypothetical protein [Leeuwenhoekiella blandensis]MBQ52317.1 hypothetical protein [Leeuwenhoekiella sp.]|tara:strand:- start:1338 stop:1796 length:459 start_codon:yes stop_codon:yes gene_type:complete